MSSAGTELLARTTRDSFLDGRLTILQPESGPRAAIDALFLAAAVPAIEGKAQRILEAGMGTAVASLALCARVKDAQITGVEVQGELAALARENARLNAFEDRCHIIETDITGGAKEIEDAGLVRESFDHVMANPPFYTRGHTREATDPQTAIAYSLEQGDLEKWVRFLTSMAAPRASLTMIHRADAMNEILGLLEGRLGALTIYPLFPHEGEPAKRILVQGIKGSRAQLTLLPGMVLHEPNGDYTKAANAVLRANAGITLRKMKP